MAILAPFGPRRTVVAGDIELASALSGNRNFDGRISPDVPQNYLCAPAAVVAYAIAGTMDFDFETQELGLNKAGGPVYLRDIWPSDDGIERALDAYVTGELTTKREDAAFTKEPTPGRHLRLESSDIFAWDEDSTHVRHAPYFEGMTLALHEM